MPSHGTCQRALSAPDAANTLVRTNALQSTVKSEFTMSTQYNRSSLIAYLLKLTDLLDRIQYTHHDARSRIISHHTLSFHTYLHTYFKRLANCDFSFWGSRIPLCCAYSYISALNASISGFFSHTFPRTQACVLAYLYVCHPNFVSRTKRLQLTYSTFVHT